MKGLSLWSGAELHQHAHQARLNNDQAELDLVEAEIERRAEIVHAIATSPADVPPRGECDHKWLEHIDTRELWCPICGKRE